MEKIQREGEPNIYSVSSDDIEMNNAIQKAKNTMIDFENILINRKCGDKNFALKVRIPTDNGAEHIWAVNITIENGNFFGVIDNLPESNEQVRLRQRILIDRHNISDWMYSENGKLRGGFTLRLLRNRMPEVERKEFDANFPFIIED